MNNPDKYLRHLYGDNYMEIPEKSSPVRREDLLKSGKFEGNAKLYFRVLLEDTDNNLRTSSHYMPPGAWTKKYLQTQSQCESDYELNVGVKVGDEDGVIYTIDARTAFIEAASQFGIGPVWEDEILRKCGEYEGISAYDNACAALRHATDQGAPVPQLKEILIFTGVKRGRLPEDHGYAVTPYKIIERITGEPEDIINRFRTRYLD